MPLPSPKRDRKPRLRVVSSQAEQPESAAAREDRSIPRPAVVAGSDPLSIDMKAAERAAHEMAQRREEERRRLRANLIAAVWVILLVAGSVWVIEMALENARLQDCYARGGRNCVKLAIPPAK